MNWGHGGVQEPNFCDGNGNMIFGAVPDGAKITFGGHNNIVRISVGAKIASLSLAFPMSNSLFSLGSCFSRVHFSARIGQDCTIKIGDGVSTTSLCNISASEGSTITVGEDAMISSGVHIMTDDSHPIFDVRTGKRVNLPKDITLEGHVWVGRQVIILGGTTVGSGSVIGAASVVKGAFPNNCIIVGTPARMVRKDNAWERPHLANVQPGYKPDASFVEKSEAFWRETELPPAPKSFFRRLLGKR